jgi:hypothetical protein
MREKKSRSGALARIAAPAAKISGYKSWKYQRSKFDGYYRCTGARRSRA